MSAAAKWKMKEKEAMASVAVKTDASGFKALKTDAPGTGGTACAADDILGRGGSQFASRTPEKSTAPGTQRPIAANRAAGDRQGNHSKLPSTGKDSAKMPQTKEVKGSQVDCYHPGASFVSPGVPKISVGDKESATNSGGRRSVGVGSRTEEPTRTTEAGDVRVSQAEDEASKDADAATAFTAGRTKGLAGFWANQTDSVKPVKKKRLTAVEDNLAPTIAENSPQPLEGVTRCMSDDPGEWKKKPIQTQESWTRNAVGSLQAQRYVADSRAPISLVGNADTNVKTAVIRVKGSSQLRPQSEPPQRPREKKAAVDRSQDSIVLAENQPEETDPDVVRSDSAAEEVVLEKGRTRNLLQHWKNTEVDYNTTKTSTSRFEGKKPAWILEIEAAKGNLGDNDDYEDGEEDDEIAESQTEEKTMTNTIATKNSERDKTRNQNGGDVNKGAAGVVESRGADKNPPLKREGIAASGETKPTSAYFKGHEKQPVPVRHLKPDCRRNESGDNKFSHFRADDQTTAKIKDVRSVGEGAPSAIIPSFDENARNKTPASSFENASRKEWKSETLTGNEPQCLPGERPATEEFRAWHGTADVRTAAQSVKRSTDYETNNKTSAEDTASFRSSTISFTTQSEIGGDHFIRYLPDSSTLGTTRPYAADAELKQTNVFEAELLEQGKPKAAERGSDVESFASSVQPQRNSGTLEMSTATHEDAYPESAAFSEFNPLTTDSPFVSSSPGRNEKTEPGSSPTSLDDLLPIDSPSPSFRLVEGVDSTSCLLPTWSVAVENTVENRENCFDYAQADSRQNEAAVYRKAVESSVDEAPDYRRTDKIEATKKSEPSQVNILTFM